MTSPFSVFFRDLRLRLGLRQKELADQLGYEQAYISSIELGKKPPSEDLLKRLMNEMGLNEKDQAALHLAVKESRRKFILPVEVPTETYLLCNELWDKIDRLYPAQIRAIREMIRIDDEIAERPRNQNLRIRRRVKEREVVKM